MCLSKSYITLTFFNKCYSNKCMLKTLVYNITGTSHFRYHLTGIKKGEMEIFVEDLPGTVDNIRRSFSGGYWAVIGICRHADRFNLLDSLASHPWIRKQLAKVYLY